MRSQEVFFSVHDVSFAMNNLPISLHLRQCNKPVASQHFLQQAQMRWNRSSLILTWFINDQLNYKAKKIILFLGYKLVARATLEEDNAY